MTDDATGRKARRDPLDRELVEPRRRRPTEPQRVGYSRGGMVSTAHADATRAGVEILADGGNAIDAAVAAAFALGVCEPQASGLGGQTMMLVHIAEPRHTFTLDGSSRAPNRATPELTKTRRHRNGYTATTVPSTPAVLAYTLKTHGTMPLARVLEPAIALADGGFEVTELFRALSKREAKKLRKFNGGEIYLKNGRRAHTVGSMLTQPRLAETLRRLADAGIADFYTGEIAKMIHDDMIENDGLIRDDDLAQIPWPIERRPLATRFRGKRVVTFPPPGAGRVLIEMLHLVENFPAKSCDPELPRGAVILAEVIRRAALDRMDRPFDPSFYPQLEDKKLLQRDYAKKAASRIKRQIRAVRSTGETTHLSVMDRFGNVVALTQSIESVFGAAVATPGLGFLYNNYMSAFDFSDISHPHFMRPNAVPWASVAPTIVFRGPRPWLAIGSPGSQRIVSAILQVLLRLEAHSPFEAVDAPRLHCSFEGKVSLEAARFRDDIPRILERHGFEVDARDPYSFYLGCVQLVIRESRGFVGVADPRRDGSAGGPLR